MKTRPAASQLRTPSILWVLILTLLAGACRSETIGPASDLDAVLEGALEIAPGELVLQDGATGLTSLRYRAKDGAVTDLPSEAIVTWTSNAPNVASVSKTGTVSGKQPGVAQITATSESGSVTLPVIVLPTPSDLRPMFEGTLSGTVGTSLPDSVAVRVVDRGGRPVAGIEVSFNVEVGAGSVSPRTATTSSDGSARALWRLGTSAGQNALRVTSEGLDDAWIHARGDANGDEDQLRLVGGDNQTGVVNQVLGQELVVKVLDQYGNPVPNAPITWSFSSAAPEAGAGTAAANAPNQTSVADAQGVARAQWRLGTRSGPQTAKVSVGTNGPEVWFAANATTEPITSVVVSPSVATIGVTETLNLSGVAMDRFGNAIPETMAWSVEDQSVVSVNSSGQVTGLSVGTTKVFGSSDGVSGAATISVQGTGPGQLLSVSGSGQSGAASTALPAPFIVRVLDAAGSPLAGVNVTWAVSAGAGSLSATSTSTDGGGYARVTYTLGPSVVLNQVTATTGTLAPVTFSASSKAGGIASVSVSPSSMSMLVGENRSLVASALDAAGNGIGGSTFQWSSSDPGVATVDGSGSVHSVSLGTATVTATSGGHSGSATISVVGSVGSLVLDIQQATLNAIGDTVHVTASAQDASGGQVSGSAIVWTSETPGLVGVDGIGRIYSMGVGAGRVKASVGNQSATVDIDSRQVMSAVGISPAALSVTAGAALQLVASPVDSNGVAMIADQSQDIFWETSNSAIATIGGTGVVQGVAVGSAQISVIWEGGASAGGRVLRNQGALQVTEGSSPTDPNPNPDQPPPPPPPLPPISNGPTPDLPREYINTNYTAPNGNIIRVPSGGDLQGAIDQAQPGDQILLAPGGVYIGNFSLPVKSGSEWIVIRTETTLPSQGTRMTPSLAAGAQLARIEALRTFSAIRADPGAHHYRLMGLEVTTTQGNPDVGEIIAFGGGMANWPHHIILDRMYVHGKPGVQIKRCVGLSTAYGAVVDSYLTDCTKFGQDSQAILMYDGPGPYKVVNNYLAGAGENVMVGGGDPSVNGMVPSDIEIRRNFFHKPDSWYSNPVGVVKNLLEFKNARRVLVEGNILEGSWSDGQTGWGVLIKSTNQDGGCNWCVSEHITMRYNVMTRMGSGISILRTNSTKKPSGQTNNVLIEHNIIDALGPKSGFGGDASWGSGFIILDGPLNVTIRHNTVMSEYHTILFAEGPTRSMVFNDNITTFGVWGIFSSFGQGANAVSHYMADGQFFGNVIAGASAGSYPANNYYPADVSGIGFTGLTNYQLSSSSPYRGLATDGTDPGADVAGVNSATSGVR